jgi:hypothetical protein
MPLGDIRSVHLPYILMRQPDGRYAFLNRERLPLGFKERGYDDEQCPIRVKVKGLTPKMASKISFDGSNDTEQIRLYDDGCIPTRSAAGTRDYMRRLALLARLKISDGGF